MFHLLKVQIIFCSHFTLKRSPSGRRLSFSASPPPRRRPGCFLTSQIISRAFEMHESLSEVTAQQLGATGPWLDRDCHRFGHHGCAAGILLSQSESERKYCSCRLGRPLRLTLNWIFSIRPPLLPPHWLFGSCTHAFHAGVSLPHKIHSDEAKCGCFAHLRCDMKMSCISVRGLKPPPGRRAISSSSQDKCDSLWINCDKGLCMSCHFYFIIFNPPV